MSDHASLTARLREIDEQIATLAIERKDTVSKINYLCLVNAMREVGEDSLRRLEEEITSESFDAKKACYFTSTSLIAWRHSLGRTFFPKAMSAIPKYAPSRMTKDEAVALLENVAAAIKQDLAGLA